MSNRKFNGLGLAPWPELSNTDKENLVQSCIDEAYAQFSSAPRDAFWRCMDNRTGAMGYDQFIKENDWIFGRVKEKVNSSGRPWNEKPYIPPKPDGYKSQEQFEKEQAEKDAEKAKLESDFFYKTIGIESKYVIMGATGLLIIGTAFMLTSKK